MTRKTYRILAEKIGRLLAEKQDEGDDVTSELISAMCSAMKEDNSAFDKEKFLEAIEKSKMETLKRWDDRRLQNLTNSIVAGNG